MRSSRGMSMFHGGVFTLVVIAGCGEDSGGQTDLAKLPPPSQAVLDTAKAKAQPNPRPRFGSPPKSEMGKQ